MAKRFVCVTTQNGGQELPALKRSGQILIKCEIKGKNRPKNYEKSYHGIRNDSFIILKSSLVTLQTKTDTSALLFCLCNSKFYLERYISGS